MEELKPCPFCGGEAEYYTYEQEHDLYDSNTLGFLETYETTEHYVGCKECLAVVGTFVTKKQAIKSWNNRAYEDESTLLTKIKSLADSLEKEADSAKLAYVHYGDAEDRAEYCAYKDAARKLREVAEVKIDANV